MCLGWEQEHKHRKKLLKNVWQHHHVPTTNKLLQSLFGTGPRPHPQRVPVWLFLSAPRVRLLCSDLPRRIAPRGKMNQFDSHFSHVVFTDCQNFNWSEDWTIKLRVCEVKKNNFIFWFVFVTCWQYFLWINYMIARSRQIPPHTWPLATMWRALQYYEMLRNRHAF